MREKRYKILLNDDLWAIFGNIKPIPKVMFGNWCRQIYPYHIINFITVSFPLGGCSRKKVLICDSYDIAGTSKLNLWMLVTNIPSYIS